MKCSICGESGHNKRTCSQQSESANNYALIVKVNNLSKEEQTALGAEFRQAKKDIAPNAMATMVEGTNAELPYTPPKALSHQ